MPFKILSLFVISILFIAGCKKDKSTIINVTVLSDVTKLAVSSTEVMLFSGGNGSSAKAVSSQTSGSDGKLSFTVSPDITYYLYIRYKTPTEANSAFIVVGKFTSQSQIDNIATPLQTPKPVVGDDMLADMDGDGKITSNDKVVVVAPPAQGSTVNATYSIK
ncbi:MAG: hypothetical protein V4592_19570 [Bacteroidota bacterium]